MRYSRSRRRRLAFSYSVAILHSSSMPALSTKRGDCSQMTQPAQPWHVPVRLEDVPETGLHLDLVADERVRAGLAALAGVPDMPRLEAVIDLARYGNGLRATGRVSATVEQICVVTLEPMENQVEESIEVIFAPPSTGDSDGQNAALEADEPPEVLSDGTADLG